MIQIVACSSSPILLAGFRSILAETGDFTISECPSFDLLAEQARTTGANMILADVACGVSLELLSGLKRGAPDASIVLWVDTVSPEFVSQALSLGVMGVLPKHASVDIYVQCLARVAEGQPWVETQLTARLLTTRRVHLTPRERQLASLLAQGLKNKEVAHRLGITEGTVKVYLSRLYGKLGVNDRFDLALVALRNLANNQTVASDNLAKRPATAAPFLMPATFSLAQSAAAR